MHQSLGIRAEVLEAEQLKQIVPDVSVHGIGLAAYEPDAGCADLR